LAGKELLIDTLGLPYTNVEIKLDAINDYDRDLWALGKVYTYSLQDKPFLHVDGDIYIWKAFDKKLLESPIIAQHLEVGYYYYNKVMKMVDANLPYVPQAIKDFRESSSRINAFNMGLAGGNDIEFFQHYAQESLNFVDYNLESLANISTGPFNTVYEQVLFYCLLQQRGNDVGLFTNTTGEKLVNKELNSLSNFRKAPNGVNLVHLYGSNKRRKFYCRELASKLKQAHPKYYDRIMDLTSVEAW
jgi:hypothetical protein